VEQRGIILQAEAQLVAEAGDLSEARALLDQALKESPEAVDLLYDRAMVLEKLGELTPMEEDLRTVIRLKPDHAHAYNALGYTLADRTQRYSEALELIQKAVKLAPDDAFIFDSLGWVNFRMGRLDEALKILKKAYDQQPDPEIAAHLAEVMWAHGDHDAARSLLGAALAKNPDNGALQAIDHRLKP
jgi:tetratricopeptide (TPR) repeat protein